VGQHSHSVIQRLEDYLTPIRESFKASIASSINTNSLETLLHLAISTSQFLNFNLDENINLYSFLDNHYHSQLQLLKFSQLEGSNTLDFNIKTLNFEEDLWIEDYNMAHLYSLNLVTLPQYYGQAGSNPHHYLNWFNVVCATNFIPEANYLTTFPTTLLEIAQEWHLFNGPFATWNELRDAFLARFRPLAFIESS